MENPLLTAAELPRFGDIKPEHVEPALREVLQDHRRRIDDLTHVAAPSFANVVAPLESMQHRLARTWSPVSHLNSVANTPELRDSYNNCLPLLSDFQTDLAHSEPLYRAYAQVAEREAATLAPAQRRLLDLALRDFKLAGVALDKVRKQRFKAIMAELTSLGAKFEENVLDATKAWSHAVSDRAQLAGLNATIVAQAEKRARDAGQSGWLLGLDQPTYVAVLTDAESPPLRRAFYEAWSTRASDQGPNATRWDNSAVMEKILALRHELARLLDFANYAELALATRMARQPAEVRELLDRLGAAARPAAERELAELTKFAGVTRLDPWDVSYWAEKLQRKLFAVSQEELRPFFPLPRVLDGLFALVGKLFHIGIAEQGGVPLWHPDVRYFVITDAANNAVGGFYLDPYARNNKRSGAWMDECRGRMHIDGQDSLPVAYLVCNFLPPAAEHPALLTHDDVVTLFHEFGHGLHHMLTRIDYPSIAGINGVAWDAVELPSQFLENFAWQPQVLSALAHHWQSGAALPAETQRQLIATRSFHAGLATLRQLEYALFDFRVHSEYDPARGGRVLETLNEVRRQVAILQPPEWNRFPHSFSHIFAGGYAAGYYSYKWAEVLAADAFAAFEESGVFDAVVAKRFLDAILSRGGSCDPLDAFIEFRGRKPDIEPLLRQHGMAS
jgi:oligopeptidase A